MAKNRQQPSRNTLLQVAGRFSKCRLLMVGDLVADHYVFGQTDRISREAPVLIVRHEHSEVKLGGGANVAANIRALGGQVTVVGLLGEDEMGAALKHEFARARISLKAVVSKKLVTETKTRILAGGVNTTRQQMLRLDRGNPSRLSPEFDAALAERVEKEARNVDAVVVSDYGAGVVGAKVREALSAVAQKGTPVCVDSRHQLRAFRNVTVCKPNEPELEALTGLKLSNDRQFHEAGQKALELLGCECLLATRGRNGMVLFQNGKPADVIPVSGHEEAVDVTGAGDTVLATLALGLASGAPPGAWARVANIAGGLVVQKQGTATVQPRELIRAIEASP